MPAQIGFCVRRFGDVEKQINRALRFLRAVGLKDKEKIFVNISLEVHQAPPDEREEREPTMGFTAQLEDAVATQELPEEEEDWDEDDITIEPECSREELEKLLAQYERKHPKKRAGKKELMGKYGGTRINDIAWSEWGKLAMDIRVFLAANAPKPKKRGKKNAKRRGVPTLRRDNKTNSR